MPINSELHSAVHESSMSRPPFAAAGAVADWFDSETPPSYLLHSAAALSDTAHRIDAEVEA